MTFRIYVIDSGYLVVSGSHLLAPHKFRYESPSWEYLPGREYRKFPTVRVL